jgi:hypothetical protein
MEEPEPAKVLWNGNEARRILARQREDGGWAYPGGGNRRIRSQENYDQIESYRQLGCLVEKFRFDREHPAVRRGAEFVLSRQTAEGDIRGIYGSQYSPNYTAGIIELLVKAGYHNDNRIGRAFDWLLSMRQNDGGWAIPLRTSPKTSSIKWTRVMKMHPVAPDPSKPSSHLVTGIVLRAFAAHPKFRLSKDAFVAGEFLCGRFFRGDSYPDRKSPGFWWRVSFPFWFTDVVSALDSLSLIGFTAERPEIGNALDRLASRQSVDGSFDLKFLRTRDEETSRWVSFAACRVFKRYS